MRKDDPLNLTGKWGKDGEIIWVGGDWMWVPSTRQSFGLNEQASPETLRALDKEKQRGVA